MGEPGVSRSLMVRNLSQYARPDDLREIAERFGEVRDVYIPRNYHTQQPRGFAFIEFQDARACEDASYDMQGIEIEGRPVEVNIAKDKRKQPDDFRPRRRFDDRDGGGGGGRRYDDRQDDRGGGGYDRRGGYDDRRGGYDDRRRDHDDRRDDRGGGYDRRGGYEDRRSGHDDRRDDRGGGYERGRDYDDRRDERPPRRARDDSPPPEAGERSRSRSRSRAHSRSRSRSPARGGVSHASRDRSRSPAPREDSMDPPPARNDVAGEATKDGPRSRERDSFD